MNNFIIYEVYLILFTNDYILYHSKSSNAFYGYLHKYSVVKNIVFHIQSRT